MPFRIADLARRLVRRVSPRSQTVRRPSPLGHHFAALEDRTVPTSLPTVGSHGWQLVKVGTATVYLQSNTKTSPVAFQPVDGMSLPTTAGQTLTFVAHQPPANLPQPIIDNTNTGAADAEYIRTNQSSGPQDGSSPGYE